jgi:DNA-directed RNA polymerase subunit L
MFKVIHKDDNDYDFICYNMETNILNGIRRLMYSDYNIYAIKETDITIRSNNSIVHNEILKHRVSLIPIDTNEICDLELYVKNKHNKTLNIYSNDLKIKNGKGSIYPNILLHKLKQNEELFLTAKTSYGNGNESSIFKPISKVYFKIMKNILIKKNIKVNKLKTYLKQHNIIKFEHDLNKENYNSLGLLYEIRSNTSFKENLLKQFGLKEDDIIIEDAHYNNIPIYHLSIESIYINPITLLQNTIKLFKDKLDNFMNSNIEVEENNNLIVLYIENGTITLCNTLSSFLRKNDEILFTHYDKHHPLDSYITLQLSLQDKNADYINILKCSIKEIFSYLDNITIN